MVGLVVLWLLMMVSMAFGQVNNERLGQRDGAEGVGVQLGVAGAAASGNLGQFSITGDLAAQYRRYFPAEDAPMTFEGAKWTRSFVLLAASGNYMAFGGQTFVDQRLVTLGVFRALEPRIGVVAVGQYQNNLVLLLDQRWTAMAGLRLRPVERRRFGLSGTLGGLVEHEVRNVLDERPDPRLMTNIRLVGRLTTRIELVPDGLTWRHTLYVEPRVDRWRDLLVLDYHTLEAHANKVISMTVDLQLRYDSEPPGELARLDTRITWGLRFRFAARPDAEPAHARAPVRHQGLASW